jgi:hypothetical protein
VREHSPLIPIACTYNCLFTLLLNDHDHTITSVSLLAVGLPLSMPLLNMHLIGRHPLTSCLGHLVSTCTIMRLSLMPLLTNPSSPSTSPWTPYSPLRSAWGLVKSTIQAAHTQSRCTIPSSSIDPLTPLMALLSDRCIPTLTTLPLQLPP